jgi:SET domain-containing protein
MTLETEDLEFVQKNTLDTIQYTVINKSTLHGFGLFTIRKIYEDTILAILDGQIMSQSKYNEIEKNIAKNIDIYKNYFFMEVNILDDKTYLVRPFRTKYSYINHSRIPNVKILQNPLRIIAIRDIESGEELTIDYREEKLSQEYLVREDKQFL